MVLRTVSVQLIDRYVDWLFGPKVWGLTIKNLQGTPVIADD